MKLFYYQRSDGLQNFGDALNSWLWPQLLPNFFDENPQSVFIGFGTLINNLLIPRMASAKRVVLFSTGVGYEKKLQQLPAHMKVYCVRGPRSALSLGFPANMAITDGAILARDLWPSIQQQRTQVSFMPHVIHAKAAGPALRQICERLQFQYIDPTEPNLEQVLRQIDQSKLLLAEAMHGAIVADALRVPWIPIRSSVQILTFKWLDWCDSVGCPYHPRYLPPLFSTYPHFARGIRSGLKSLRYWSQSIYSAPTISLHALAQAQLGILDSSLPFEKALRQAASSPGYLSDIVHWTHLHDRLLDRLNNLQLTTS